MISSGEETKGALRLEDDFHFLYFKRETKKELFRTVFGHILLLFLDNKLKNLPKLNLHVDSANIYLPT